MTTEYMLFCFKDRLLWMMIPLLLLDLMALSTNEFQAGLDIHNLRRWW